MARSEALQGSTSYARLPVFALGLSLSLFFVISFLLCVLFYWLFPNSFAEHAMLKVFLPWFEALTWQTFAIGLATSFGWGWYVALVFGPLYNLFAARGG
jgi:hypothetical protein